MALRSRHVVFGMVATLLVGIAAGQSTERVSAGQPAKAVNQAAVEQHIDKVTSCLTARVLVKGDPNSCSTLAERMAQLHIPGVSIAVIHNGSIEWARGFGVARVGGPAVDADTMFQAGSISKPVSAMAALKLVEEKKLSLDRDVNTELISWKVPDSPEAHGKPVTLRELLTLINSPTQAKGGLVWGTRRGFL